MGDLSSWVEQSTTDTGERSEIADSYGNGTCTYRKTGDISSVGCHNSHAGGICDKQNGSRSSYEHEEKHEEE